MLVRPEARQLEMNQMPITYLCSLIHSVCVRIQCVFVCVCCTDLVGVLVAAAYFSPASLSFLSHRSAIVSFTLADPGYLQAALLSAVFLYIASI